MYLNWHIIVCDSKQYCKEFLNKNYLDEILNLLENKLTNRQIRSITWTISNLCHGIPNEYKNIIQRLVKVQTSFLNFDDQYILSDSCFGITNLVQNEQIIQTLFEENTINTIIFLLKEKFSSPQKKRNLLLLLITIIKFCNYKEIESLIEIGILKSLSKILNSNNNELFVEIITKLIKKLCKGGEDSISKIMDSGVIHFLFIYLYNEDNYFSFEMKKILVKFFYLWYSKAKLQDCLQLTEQGSIELLIQEIMILDEIEILIPSLKTVLVILSLNSYYMNEILESNGAFEIIGKLNTHKNQTIQSASIQIIGNWEKILNNRGKQNVLELENNIY
ncbi:importin subunit alpha [Anaeramoeba flamelloides]|uniref:Importin subunit alpha n=1 Tax=Anaeramoeba flamelloides TaxID=1746091 RepID=A0AAV8A0U3_9EUKA|nr:importin subunit alpha [Anaeramoeba flamelloides]